MEITGSFSPLVPYPSTSQTTAQAPQNPPQEEQNRQASTAIKPAIKTSQNEAEPNRRRFNTQQKDLSHSARQALNSYMDSDFAGGPELMNRVDVYA